MMRRVTTDRFPASPEVLGQKPQARLPARARRGRRDGVTLLVLLGCFAPGAGQLLRVAKLRPAREGHGPAQDRAAEAIRHRLQPARPTALQPSWSATRPASSTWTYLPSRPQRFVEERVSPAADGELPSREPEPHRFMNSGCRTSMAASSASPATWRSCAPFKDQWRRASSLPASSRPRTRRHRRRGAQRPGCWPWSAPPRRRLLPDRPCRFHRVDLRPAAELLEVKVAGRDRRLSGPPR